jgi:hypothetical protein
VNADPDERAVQLWDIRGFHVFHSTDCHHLGGDHQGVLGSCIQRGPQDMRFAKTCLPKLVEEGAAFLRAHDSGKPVGLVPLIFG